VIFRGLFGIVCATSKFVRLFPRFLTEPITTFSGALSGERESRGAEKPLISGRQLHETDYFMEIEDSLPRFRYPEKLICDAKKKILKFCVLFLHLKAPLPIFIPYYKRLCCSVTQNNRQNYISFLCLWIANGRQKKLYRKTVSVPRISWVLLKYNRLATNINKRNSKCFVRA
jgi:hypothetical protein